MSASPEISGRDRQPTAAKVEGDGLIPIAAGEPGPADEPAGGNSADNAVIEDPEGAASFGTHVHKYLCGYIDLADKKAAFIFAAVAGILAYLHSEDGTLRWLSDPRTWTLQDILANSAVVGLILSAVFAFDTVAPRLQGAPEGAVFWRAIAGMATPRDYVSRVASLGTSGLTRELLMHCHELAGVCDRKYRSVGRAIWLGCFGLAVSLGYLVLHRLS